MKDPCQKIHARWGLAELREKYPALRLTHLSDCSLEFEGRLAFRAVKDGYEEIEDVYQIRTVIPYGFPAEEALVFEVGGRIPNTYHKFEDESLCLGSPLRIRQLLWSVPTLVGLIELLVIPYLYNHGYQERVGQLPVGELAHGAPGLIRDYEQMFALSGAKPCVEALRLLSLKKRIANKMQCPCGSGLRVGRCHGPQWGGLRQMAPRNYFVKQASQLSRQLELWRGTREGGEVDPVGRAGGGGNSLYSYRLARAQGSAQ